MKALRLTAVFFFVLFCLLVTQVNAETIVSVPQGTSAFAIASDQYLVMGWTAPQAYSNVVITAPLYTSSEVNHYVTAYLTDQIGSGTTAASNEITSAFITLYAGQSDPITLFSGLSLGPGAYYLTLSATHDDYYCGWGKGGSPIETASGVTVIEKALYAWTSDSASTIDSSYAPASRFSELIGSQLAFNVSGTAVPEPTTMLLLGLGLFGLGGLRKMFQS